MNCWDCETTAWHEQLLWLSNTRVCQHLSNIVQDGSDIFFNVYRNDGDRFLGVSFHFTSTMFSRTTILDAIKNTDLYNHEWFIDMVYSYFDPIQNLPQIKLRCGEHILEWDIGTEGYLAEVLLDHKNGKYTWKITPMHFMFKVGFPLVTLQFITLECGIFRKDEDTKIENIRCYTTIEFAPQRREIAMNNHAYILKNGLILFTWGGSLGITRDFKTIESIRNLITYYE